MMIELCKAKILEGQIAKAVESIGDGGAPLADFVQQRLNICTIHQIPSFSVLAA
jgi:hypothetical protein